MNSNNALADGLFWYAEKLMWGYEDTAKDQGEAFRLYKQAAALGSADAHLRVGLLLEHGKGTDKDPTEALKSYKAAMDLGNIFALAAIAQLLTRARQIKRAEAFWERFFASLGANPNAECAAATIGEALHDYVASQLRQGLSPKYNDILVQHEERIARHHQMRLSQPMSEEALARLDEVAAWMRANHLSKR